MKDRTFTIPLLASCAIHVLVIMLASISVHNNNFRRQDFLPIDLVDTPRRENLPPPKKVEAAPPEIKKPAPPLQRKVEKPKAPTPQIAKAPTLEAEAPTPPPPVREEAAKAIETKPATTPKPDPPPSFASDSPIEGGGSEAGAGNLFSNGDVGVVPGAGTAGGGGGTAASGLGRGSAAPGLPGQTAPLKTNRAAKPIQTARAVYPPMALRAGLESDVTLRIEVDAEGKVTKAEITKSGGASFDEEALKAVKQSRFEPAQKDGQNVAAEFAYIYRFRLQK